MALVTATESRAESRNVYVPPPPAGMAHRSYLSPDQKWVLAVEMDAMSWLPCRLLPFDATSAGKAVGPPGGRCTSAAWSPDGRWMYLSVDTGGGFHIWRQRFPDGAPEQVTSGTTQEEGITMAPDGHSFVTSVGIVESSIWIHDERGERQVSTEGYASFSLTGSPRSYFSADGKKLYYLMRRESARDFDDGELWVAELDSGRTERLLPGFTIGSFDISADGKRVAFSARDAGGKRRLRLASLERRFAPRRIPSSLDLERRPVFGPSGDIFFRALDASGDGIHRMKEDGSERQRVRPDAVGALSSVSPDGEWMAVRSTNVSGEETGSRLPMLAYPVRGGPPVKICEGCRLVKWSADGKFLYFSYIGMGPFIEAGTTFALPIRPGKPLPELPASGVRSEAEAAALPGVYVIEHGNISPGRDPSVYAFTRISAHRNLYRVPVP